jgi:hypothetical protein
MAGPLTSESHLPLPEGQQPAVAISELPGENSPHPPERKHTFGTLSPVSSDWRASGTKAMREPLFLPGSSDDEPGKHTLFSTGSENDFYTNVPFS